MPSSLQVVVGRSCFAIQPWWELPPQMTLVKPKAWSLELKTWSREPKNTNGEKKPSHARKGVGLDVVPIEKYVGHVLFLG